PAPSRTDERLGPESPQLFRLAQASDHRNSDQPDIPASSLMKPIRKAILPVAGLGTRFLPATKAMPKEMLPVVDRPLIQHVVAEAGGAGIKLFISVPGRNKGVIEAHFARHFNLELPLPERNRRTELDLLARVLRSPGQTISPRQQQPLGLG